MGESVLENRLKAVARRLYRLRVLRRQTVCWLLVIVPAVILCVLLPTTGLPLRRESVSLIAAGIIALVLARWKLAAPTWLETARLVEQHNPALNDILLTALRHRVDDSRTDGSRVSPVLTARVREQANNIALVADWGSVASRRQIARWFAASLAAFAILVSSVVAASRVVQHEASNSVLPAPNSAIDSVSTSVTVEPGDTEVEQGTGLTVVARFSGPVPMQAAVFVRADQPATNSAEELRSRQSTHTMSPTVDADVFMVRLPPIDEDSTYVIRYGDEDTPLSEASDSSDVYRVATFVRPRVIRVDATIKPPRWTGRAPSTIEDTLRVVAIEGSIVSLRVHLNKPVTKGSLLSESELPISLTEDPAVSTTLQTTLTATDDADWQIALTDADGRSASDETSIALRIVHNEPPSIRITFPRPDQSVSALQEVLTEAEAVDDFGIVDYGITYSLSGKKPTTVSLNDEDSTSTEMVSMAHIIDLESLDAAPDDLLTWHFYADTYTAAGEIQRTLSDLMFADVRRFEETFRQGPQSSPGQGGQGGSSDSLLQIQRQIAIAVWNVQRSLVDLDSTTDDAAESVSTIMESQEVAREQLGRIKQNAPVNAEIYDAIEEADDYMLDVLEALEGWSLQTPEPALSDASAGAQGALRQLLRLRAAEHQVQQSQPGQGSGQGSAAQQNLDQLELDNDRNRYESQQQAAQEQPPEQREQLQILNRLKELARRQDMLNERLKALESELRNTTDEEERKRLERELKRLRDEQQEMLRDVDELRERMDQSSTRNDPQQQELREKVDQARTNVRNASRAMDSRELSEALSAGTRAERQFDQLQEDFRKQTSSAFRQAAKELRQEARELSQRQQDIQRDLNSMSDSSEQQPPADRPRSLRSEEPDQDIQNRLGQQREALQQLLQRSEDMVKQAEESEPLLARELFDAVKQAEEMRTSDALRAAEFLAGRGLWDQVKDPEQAARRGIERLKEGVEKAAEAVLGSEAEALRRAQQTLEELSEELAEEVQASAPQQHAENSGRQQSDRQPPAPAESNPQQSGQPTPTPSDQQTANSSPGNQPADGSQSPSGQPTSRQNSFLQRGGSNGGGTATATHRPLTGGDFLNWSDRLRDVEEMLDDPDLRQRVAAVRDRARSMRAEFKRHGTEPQWDLVQSGLLAEMKSLQRRLTQDIAALSSDRSMVPIDREPVPEEFDELVQRYYELLGQDRQEPTP